MSVQCRPHDKVSNIIIYGHGILSFITRNILSTVLHFRLEYELLADFLVEKRGYDPSLKQKAFDTDSDFVCKV